MILAQITLTQDFAATTAAALLVAEVTVLDSPIGAAELSQDFDDSAPLVQPRLQLDDGAGGTLDGINVVTPAVVPVWTVGANDPGAVTVGDLEVGSDLESGARTWSRSVEASTGSRRTGDMVSGPLGYEIETGGPPPGEGVEVSLSLTLLGRGSLAGTSATLPLLTGGFTDASKRTWDGEGHILELSGAGPEHEYRDREIDISLAAGHGLTQGEIAILALQAGEVPDEQIEIDPGLGAPRSIPVEESCTPLWRFLDDLLHPIGYVVMAGRHDNVFRAVSLEVGDESPVATIIAGAAGDLAKASAGTISADANRPTCAVVTGNRLADLASGSGAGSGILTETIVIKSFEEGFILPVNIALQSAASSTIVATGNVPTAKPGLTKVHQTTIKVTYEDSCEILTYVKDEGYFSPQMARYVAAATTTGETRTYPPNTVYFYDSIPVADDSTEGFQWETHRWTVLSEQWSEPQFGADGRRTGTLTRKSGWKNPSASIKGRADPSVTWETVSYTAGRLLSAGFDGVLFDAERYFAGPGTPDESFPTSTTTTHPGLTTISRHLEVAVETRTIDEDDYETAVETATTAYGIRAGVTQLYPSGTSNKATEVGLTTTQREDRAVANKPITVRTDTDAQGKTSSTVTTGDQGGIPAAEICDAEEIDRDRQQTFDVTICVELQQPDLTFAESRARTINLSSDFIETEAEAEAWARRELRIARGFPVELELASPMPVVDAGDVVNVSIPELGLDADMKVWEHDVTVEGGAGGRVVDKLGLLLTPEVL